MSDVTKEIIYPESDVVNYDKQYVDANEQHVGRIVVYGAADNKLYTSTNEDKKQIKAEVAQDLFKKGLLLVATSTGYVAPVGFVSNKVQTLDSAGGTLSIKEWQTATS